MNRRPELPQVLREQPFSRRAAIASGVSPSRLRAADLEHPFHGVHRAVGASDGILWQCRAYQERMNAAHCFSHYTAAELYGLPLPRYVQAATESRAHRRQPGIDPLHVSTMAPSRAPSGAGVRGHSVNARRWARRELLLSDPRGDHVFAFPVASPEFVWAQLADALDDDDLVALGDAVVGGSISPDIRSGGPLASLADLRVAAEANRGCRGAASMTRAIDRIRSGSLSRPESLLRVMLVRAGLPEPFPNRRITDDHGQMLFMPDLCWPEYRVLIEYQGDGHRNSTAKFRNDITRLAEYHDGGWFPIQASARDVFEDPNPFMARVWRRLASGGWDPRRHQLRQIASARP